MSDTVVVVVLAVLPGTKYPHCIVPRYWVQNSRESCGDVLESPALGLCLNAWQSHPYYYLGYCPSASTASSSFVGLHSVAALRQVLAGPMPCH